MGARFTERSHVSQWDIEMAANLRYVLRNIKLECKDMQGMWYEVHGPLNGRFLCTDYSVHF